jgi:hypothetical protein
MKKILLGALVLLSVYGFKASAQVNTSTASTGVTTHHHHEYYYYRSSNVYYDPEASVYVYYDEPSSKWLSAQKLPSNLVIANSPRYTIVYDGDDVWQQNAVHLKKYKVKKNGRIKIKPDKDFE